MGEIDDENPGAAWEPVGLKAAAEAAASGADAGPAPDHGTPVDATPRLAGAESWERVVAVMLDLIFGRLEQRDPLWKLSHGERESLAGVWGDYLAELVGKAPGALGAALLTTGVVVGPRLVEDAKKRRSLRVVDVDAEVRPGPQ